MYADILFPTSRDLILTYKVPANYQKKVQTGQVALVEVGNAERKGIILSLKNDAGRYHGRMKEISGLESEIPLITDELMRLCSWAADYYLCSIGQVVRQFINKSFGKYKEKSGPDITPGNCDAVSFTKIQKQALEELKTVCGRDKHRVALLHGVTGSGKTLLYIELIKQVRKKGKSVLVLVPEIGLSGPLWKSIQNRLDEPVSLLHSNMSAGDRMRNWMRVRKGDSRIAVGARSAVWAPLEDLGLIIVDEEHDSSYKQNEGVPRYNARDVAVYRGYSNDIPVVLGSATPSLESYYHAEKGKYTLVRLKERYSTHGLPAVEVVDMRQEHELGNWSIFSGQLIGKIRDRLSRKEQVILLLNRRGFSPILLCKNCGHTVRCRNCDITMTYHKTGNKAVCHYCGFRIHAPDTCPKCGGSEMKYKGTGIQRVETEIKNLFSDAAVMRMDTDTTRKRQAHAEILAAFRNHEADILLGTQMVAKGLDFGNVTLVGVISADTGLNLPDFRATEKTFQLLSQVAGRPGRGTRPGEVVLQTYSPDETAVRYTRAHDYEGFYEVEKKCRKDLLYPPFNRIAQITLSHGDEKKLEQQAQKLVKLLKAGNRYQIQILGPVSAPLARQKNMYRKLIMLKGKSSAWLHQILKNIRLKDQRSVQIIIDMDPNFML